jgi:hypothetical protein
MHLAQRSTSGRKQEQSRERALEVDFKRKDLQSIAGVDERALEADKIISSSPLPKCIGKPFFR